MRIWQGIETLSVQLLTGQLVTLLYFAGSEMIPGRVNLAQTNDAAQSLITMST
jgi:hypothetical protein